MKLLRFCVKNFRSIANTGWIDANDVTALIGTNESGKSNLLLALWKLKPARDGEIDLQADAPRKDYTPIRNLDKKPIFIEAEFELDSQTLNKVIQLTGAPAEEVQLAFVARALDGKYTIGFPNAASTHVIPKTDVLQLLDEASDEISGLSLAGKTEEPLREEMIAAINEARQNIESISRDVPANALTALFKQLSAPDLEQGLKKSVIVPAYQNILKKVGSLEKIASRPSPSSVDEARNVVLKAIPSFVYYANYGNLDSEIYLPHVIANMKRKDLGNHEAAKVRTLKVLFEYVELEPEEILELGREVDIRERQPTEKEIEETNKRKKEREILLQSASAQLTDEFRDWWRQGNYRFRFQADGNHFRIWVSDDIRPQEIELEGRSAGLQWFISFFLVFLVERSETHKNTILLLDEPGVSLHPIAQRDLFEFFENLAEENQIFYTAHSPFMVDADHLDRVRAVYFDDDGEEKGLTKVSSDLRAKEKKKGEVRSIYSVHAALELTVSPVLLLGGQPTIVEGTSDQYYLSAIKNYLIARGLVAPKRELLFIPSGSFKGIKAVLPVITGVNEQLPFVILDSDKPGEDMAIQLRSSLYSAEKEKIIQIGELVPISGAEIEDIFPTDFIAYVITRYLRGPEEEFSDYVTSETAIIPQIEAYAQSNRLSLEDGWKVEVAKRTKERLLQKAEKVLISDKYVKIWTELFKRIS
ncbi:MAG: AAA family ATPase [Anaerolineae bacterium]|nr:AAA family ATPase [Anaerolineae bacterium]